MAGDIDHDMAGDDCGLLHSLIVGALRAYARMWEIITACGKMQTCVSHL